MKRSFFPMESLPFKKDKSRIHYIGFCSDEGIQIEDTGHLRLELTCTRGGIVGFTNNTYWSKPAFSSDEMIHIIAKKVTDTRFEATHVVSDAEFSCYTSSLPIEAAIIAMELDGVNKCDEAKLFDGRYGSGCKPNPLNSTAMARLEILECDKKLPQKIINTLKCWLKNKKKDGLKASYYLSVAPTYMYRRQNRSYDEILTDFSSLCGYEKLKLTLANDIVSKDRRAESQLPRGNRYLFVGPKGVGKHTIAGLYAQACGLPLVEIDCTMVSSALDLLGLNSSYDNSTYGQIFKAFTDYGTSEIVLVFNNLDRLTNEATKDGNPFGTVASLVGSDSFTDAFVSLPVSTAHTDFFAFAESLDAVPSGVLQHFKVIKLDPYTFAERVNVCKSKLPDITHKLDFTDEVLEYIARNYSDDDGANSILRNVRKVADEFENRHFDNHHISVDEVKKILEKDVSDNPLIEFNRHYDSYTADQICEIRKATSQINLVSIDPVKKELETRRRNALIKLYERPQQNIDFFNLGKHLENSHYGMFEVKRKIVEAIIVQNRSSRRPMRSILLYGPGGTGKSTIAESIADGMGRAFTRISLNGIGNPSVLRGTKSCFSQANYGAIIEAMLKDPCGVILLDEVDKLNPALADTLLDLIDSTVFTDEFLNVPVDTSGMMFIFSANDVGRISPYFYNRFELKIEVQDYTAIEKAEICRSHIIPSMSKAYGIKITCDEQSLERIINLSPALSGIRGIKAAINSVVTHRFSSLLPSIKEVVIDEELVEEVLGNNSPFTALPTFNKPGGAVALGVSGDGRGVAFPVFTTLLDNDKGQVIITGSAGDDVRETVEVCRTILRTRYNCKNLATMSMHIHFGESSVKKSGTSAGAAIFVSMFSAVFNVVVPQSIACTGEIDTLGNIYPVGGVKSKLIGAQQASCERVFIPAENYGRLRDCRFGELKIEPISDISEVVSCICDNAHEPVETDESLKKT